MFDADEFPDGPDFHFFEEDLLPATHEIDGSMSAPRPQSDHPGAPAPKSSARGSGRSKSHGGFFAVDLRMFDRVCDLGSINAVVAYLVMARGTGGDNRTTSWSVNAIEAKTGISRPRAQNAIAELVRHGLATRGGSETRPRYKLPPPLGAPDDYEPDWTWIPNALVDPGGGKGFGALSPVERLRKAQNLEAFRVLVALYNAQSLANDGGLDWREGGIFVPYERALYGRVGALNVWGFDAEGAASVYHNAPYARRYYGPGANGQTFWDAMTVIRRAGLLEFVPHLLDGSSQEAEIIHPIATFDVGEEFEQAVFMDADAAVRSILSEPLLARLDVASPSIVVPVPITSPEVAVVGIGRLRYRPRTHATAKWWSDMRDRCREACDRYQAYSRGEQRAPCH